MEIATPTNFFQILKGKHILLDTSVFIDALNNPTKFVEFFNTLREHKITITTIAPVLIEFLQGAPDKTKFNYKRNYVLEIVDTVLPLNLNVDIKENTLSLIEKITLLYREEGKSLSVTDLCLGQTLMQYPQRLFLVTKNTTEFPITLFNLVTYFNLIHRKGIHSYGVYEFPDVL